MLARPDTLVLNMPFNGIQNDLFHILAWNQDNADSPVVPKIIFLTPLGDVILVNFQSSGTSPGNQDC